ncbi:MAG: hypothetical protein BWX81_00341 [Spirochaetes bacterium ADurb.Bin110]|nr:MAG: hypothetical protein BWX81_00341 [Spirochaetes bacterium ADurb.Bin110]
MKRFSQRIGAAEVPTVIQLEGISDALRNSIWNYIHTLFDEGDSGWWRIAENSAQFFFKVPVDELPHYNHRRMEWIKQRVYGMAWYEVYDFAEFVTEWYEKSWSYPKVRKAQIQAVFNRILETEFSGYRFIQGELAPISNPAEVSEIEGALGTTALHGLTGAHAHISTALQLLAKRPDPDYRNSIKESISAVEAIVKQLGSPDSQGLSGALNELSKKISLHGGFRAGLLSLYGYTSDKGGIRHAMLDEPKVGYDEAKYMAVACSAFVNYLAAKANQSGLLGKQK